MKQFSFFKLGLLVLISFSLLQCKKDNNNDGVTDPESGECTITWKLDGQPGESMPAVCLYLDNTLNLGIIGSSEAFLQVSPLTSTGEFDLATVEVQLIIDMDADTRLAAESGTITVTELSSNKAKGTFTATMRDFTDVFLTGPTYQVTEGSFEANF